MKINNKTILLKFLFTVTLIMLTSNIAQSKQKKKIEWEIKYNLETVYDDNILGYSDKYYDKFINRQDPGRFHIETFDDMLINNSLDISASYNFFKRYKTELNFGISYKKYINNPIKDWLIADVSLSQEVSNKLKLSLGYSLLPKFYIRHYRDFDYALQYGYSPESLREYSFSKENIFLKSYYNYNSKLNLSLGLSYSSYVYPSYFTEYDSKDYALDIGADYTANTKIKYFGNYKFIYSDARGFEGTEPTPYIYTHSDPTYYEHQFSLGARYYLPRLFRYKNYAKLTLFYNRAIFTTDHASELDDLHSGRVDNEFKASLNYTFNYSDNLSFGLAYNYFIKRCQANSDINRQTILDEKDYNKNTFTFDIYYKFSNK
jgi:hypothetical protein